MSAASQAASVNARASTAANILGQALKTAPKAAQGYALNAALAASTFSAEKGSYWLSVVFYLFVYIFGAFLISVFVHFTITPVFVFKPGAKGIFNVPGTQGDAVFFNDKSQPPPGTTAPPVGHALLPKDKNSFVKEYSFSIDVLLRGIESTTPNRRIILLKSFQPFKPDPNSSTETKPFETAILDTQNLLDYITQTATMGLYLTETNDLVCTFVSATNGTPTAYSTAPLKNIPLHTPFRITVVVEERTFSLYLNGRQAFQRTLPSPLTLPTGNRDRPQAFYVAPEWANTPSKSVYIQNLHIWPQAISSYEVQHASPALPLREYFDLPPDPTGRCPTS